MKPLAFGESAPWFTARELSGNDGHVFDAAAGRVILLLFFGSAGQPACAAALSLVMAQRSVHVDRLIARERLRQAQETLEALDPRVATVFRRYRIDGVDQAVIAREVGISRVSVENDLQKAYRALSELKARFKAE